MLLCIYKIPHLKKILNLNSDLDKEVGQISLTCWCIIYGFIWKFWVVILDEIHFTDIIQVALLLWQDLERVEKANIPSGTWLIWSFTNSAAVCFALILLSTT